MCGKDTMQAAGTVTKKLAKWLAEKGYVEDTEDAQEQAGEAAKDLPNAQTVLDILNAYCDEHAPAKHGGEIEDHFYDRPHRTRQTLVESADWLLGHRADSGSEAGDGAVRTGMGHRRCRGEGRQRLAVDRGLERVAVAFRKGRNELSNWIEKSPQFLHRNLAERGELKGRGEDWSGNGVFRKTL